MVASWKKIFQHFDANRKFIGMGWVLGFLSFLKSDNWAIRFFLKSTNTFGYVMVKIWPESILVKICWLEEKSNGSVTWPEKTQKTQNPTRDPSLKIWKYDVALAYLLRLMLKCITDISMIQLRNMGWELEMFEINIFFDLFLYLKLAMSSL